MKTHSSSLNLLHSRIYAFAVLIHMRKEPACSRGWLMGAISFPKIQFAAINLVGGVLIVGAWQYAQNLVPPSLPPDHPIQVESRRLEKARLAQLAFREYLYNVRQDIAWRGLPLMAAALRVQAYCQENYPPYLNGLATSSPAGRIPEKIARNLVLDFQHDGAQAPSGQWPPDVLHRLEKEMPVSAHSPLSNS
jgi:hypothetical protein